MLTGYVRDAFREGYEQACSRSGPVWRASNAFARNPGAATGRSSGAHRKASGDINAAPVTFSRDPRTRCRVSHDGSAEKGDTTMFTRIAIATAIVLGTVSGSVAMAKNTSRYDVFVNGKKVGTDPDPTIRAQLAHDPSQGRD
jgi:hypothetical protein